MVFKLESHYEVIKLKRIKRILALCGAVLLGVMYAMTLIFAFFDHTKSLGFLKASIACTILLPVLLYAYILIYKLTHNNDSDSE